MATNIIENLLGDFFTFLRGSEIEKIVDTFFLNANFDIIAKSKNFY